MSSIRGGDELLTAFIPLKPPPPPPEQREEPPPPAKPPPKLQSKPIKQLEQPKEEIRMETPQLEFEINPSLDLGVAVPAPPPMPKLKKPAMPLGQGDRDAMLISRLPPIYPYSARRRGREGSVEVRFMVDQKGVVQNPEIVRARPSGYFEEAVLKAVSRWRFKPAIKDGKPVSAMVQTTIDFKLER